MLRFLVSINKEPDLKYELCISNLVRCCELINLKTQKGHNCIYIIQTHILWIEINHYV